MRRRERTRRACKSGLIIFAVAAAIVAVSNVVLFHLMHVHLDAKDITSIAHLNSHFENINSEAKNSDSDSSDKSSGDSVAQKDPPLEEGGDEADGTDEADDAAAAGDEAAAEDAASSDSGDEQKVVQLSPEHHAVAGLNCADHGGPDNKIAEEMIFWSDIEADQDYKSPFYDEEKYLTFEPDHGGWNNIRMAMETVLVFAHAMGRTLVLPPEKRMYLLGKGEDHEKHFTFNDFFHLDAIALEHEGLNVITMEEFLKRKGVTGKLKSLRTGEVVKPPNDETNWNGKDPAKLWSYLQKVGKYPDGWEPTSCVAVIPSSDDPKHVEELNAMMAEIKKEGPLPDPAKGAFDGKPTNVDASTKDRLREMLATRDKLCIYDSELQKEEIIHFKVDSSVKARMLTHFYAFVFFQDWRQDLWTKRFIRDHIRYVDEIVCAAARVVHAVREKAAEIVSNNPDGLYNSFHVRRGDFQYKLTRISADKLYEQSKDELTEGSVLYIATDERDKSFFNPLKEHYRVFFMDDFKDLIQDINPNYYGMLDQLVAYKGDIFFGTWFSTLTGYINRMRGYYNAKHNIDGYKEGVIKSYYFVPEEKKQQMRQYRAVKKPIYMREFPVSWRDIDKGIGEV
mmetsp:Transcript_4344/g.6371  ORF Transcript_4344/g.6371 Transcript_4344/m.6371 type:complete len:621 (-) Transcript_4344:121-1983(-)